MLPKYNKHQLVWIVVIIIAILYIIAPHEGITLIIHQIFHTILAFLLQILG
jgi:hypothetical protein